MIARFGHWLGGMFKTVMTWYDARPGWLQLVIVVVLILAIVALAHVDELRRERQWRAFRRWLHGQHEPLKGMKR